MRRLLPRHSREGGNPDPTGAESLCMIEIPAFAGMTERAGMSREFFHTPFRGNENWYRPLSKAAGLLMYTFTMLRRERARFVAGAAS